MKRSKKLRLVRSLIASLLIALMVVSLSAPEAVAKSSKTKTITAYRQVVVNGNYAYCAAYDGLYKVNLKTETKKLMVPAAPDADSSVGRMKIYKGYLYYVDWSNQLYAKLHRIKLSGKNKKFLANIVDYAISNNKIYYIAETKYEKRIKKSMKLNGKGKKKSSYKVVLKEKKSNKAGYYISSVLTKKVPHYDEDLGVYDYDEYYTEYLVTPSRGKIALDDYVIPYNEN